MKKFFLVALAIIQFQICFSQGPIITSLQSNAALFKASVQANSAKRAINDTLKLPFFEDFTSTLIYPDAAKWLDKNVYVNSHFAISPPSYGVATFDNLNSKGKPYNDLSGNTRDICDLLTSKPINLKYFISGITKIPYAIKDSIYLSFFYQAQGLGDVSDGSDSLVLRFIDSTGASKTVWKVTGGKVKPFKQVLVPINKGIYLHKGFKFVFANYGKNTGNMNQWHLDFIRLKPGRNAHDTDMADVAINAVPTGPLRWYESMPYDHFKADVSANLIDSNLFHLKNNNVSGANFQYSMNIFNQYNKLVFNQSITTSNNIPGLGDTIAKIPQFKLDTFSGKHPKVFVKYTITPNPGQDNMIASTYFDLNRNNDYTKTIEFNNYLAYDDGSAEGGYGLDYSALPPGPGYAAVKFVNYKADTLRGLSIFFNRSVADVSTKPFSLMVWKTISEPPANNMNNDVILKNIPINFPTYIDTINGFVNYVFDTSIVLPKGNFYVGWKQNSNFILNIGYDNNYHYNKQSNYRNPNLFYNLLGYWDKVGASITGVPMIRPIMGGVVKTNIPGAVKEISKLNTVVIYPNPSHGQNILNIQSDVLIKKVSLIDITGKVVTSLNEMDINSINVAMLNNGIYTIILTDINNKQTFHKYIKTE